MMEFENLETGEQRRITQLALAIRSDAVLLDGDLDFDALVASLMEAVGVGYDARISDQACDCECLCHEDCEDCSKKPS